VANGVTALRRKAQATGTPEIQYRVPVIICRPVDRRYRFVTELVR
jgi:hypothetical protein